MPRIINLDACKIPRTFAGISFRILAIRRVMTRLWHWPGPRPPSQWWLRGMAQTHDVLTHEILTVFTHPRLAKHGSYWELWLASCLMTIVMAAICDWSVTSHTGLWLADNVSMYHCTSHYPCLSLSCPILNTLIAFIDTEPGLRRRWLCWFYRLTAPPTRGNLAGFAHCAVS